MSYYTASFQGLKELSNQERDEYAQRFEELMRECGVIMKRDGNNFRSSIDLRNLDDKQTEEFLDEVELLNNNFGLSWKIEKAKDKEDEERYPEPYKEEKLPKVKVPKDVQDKAERGIEADREARGYGEPRDLLQRLANHLGISRQKAEQLIHLLGNEKALALLPERGSGLDTAKDTETERNKFMGRCMRGGKSMEECAEAWDKKTQKSSPLDFSLYEAFRTDPQELLSKAGYVELNQDGFPIGQHVTKDEKTFMRIQWMRQNDEAFRDLTNRMMKNQLSHEELQKLDHKMIDQIGIWKAQKDLQEQLKNAPVHKRGIIAPELKVINSPMDFSLYELYKTSAKELFRRGGYLIGTTGQ